ncbi:MAG: MBL fold metallo-hydrolase, partial [Solirubrobacterales bacterium]|nr:MBL fold metallo-hydrolase [Solirubrobacterales bacterium]
MTRDVAPGVHRVEDAIVNWYLVEDDDGVLVVDAGTPPSWKSLRDALSQLGRTFGELRALVLTHGHFDHVGFARRAQEELQLPVLCSPPEVEIARHPRRYPTERSRIPYFVHPRGAVLLGRLLLDGAAFARGLDGLRTFAPGDVLEDLPGGPVVLDTPGHTPGHVSFHLPDRDCVIAGDALVTLDPYTGRTGPRLVARGATADSARAAASLDAIAATGARVVLPGHGEPWLEGAQLAAEQAR